MLALRVLTVRMASDKLFCLPCRVSLSRPFEAHDAQLFAVESLRAGQRSLECSPGGRPWGSGRGLGPRDMSSPSPSLLNSIGSVKSGNLNLTGGWLEEERRCSSSDVAWGAILRYSWEVWYTQVGYRAIIVGEVMCPPCTTRACAFAPFRRRSQWYGVGQLCSLRWWRIGSAKESPRFVIEQGSSSPGVFAGSVGKRWWCLVLLASPWSRQCHINARRGEGDVDDARLVQLRARAGVVWGRLWHVYLGLSIDIAPTPQHSFARPTTIACQSSCRMPSYTSVSLAADP